MKASKFTDAQNAFIIRQGDDGIPVAEICRKPVAWLAAPITQSMSPSADLKANPELHV